MLTTVGREENSDNISTKFLQSRCSIAYDSPSCCLTPTYHNLQLIQVPVASEIPFQIHAPYSKKTLMSNSIYKNCRVKLIICKILNTLFHWLLHHCTIYVSLFETLPIVQINKSSNNIYTKSRIYHQNILLKAILLLSLWNKTQLGQLRCLKD